MFAVTQLVSLLALACAIPRHHVGMNVEREIGEMMGEMRTEGHLSNTGEMRTGERLTGTGFSGTGAMRTEGRLSETGFSGTGAMRTEGRLRETGFSGTGAMRTEGRHSESGFSGTGGMRTEGGVIGTDFSGTGEMRADGTGFGGTGEMRAEGGLSGTDFGGAGFRGTGGHGEVQGGQDMHGQGRVMGQHHGIGQNRFGQENMELEGHTSNLRGQGSNVPQYRQGHIRGHYIGQPSLHGHNGVRGGSRNITGQGSMMNDFGMQAERETFETAGGI